MTDYEYLWNGHAIQAIRDTGAMVMVLQTRKESHVNKECRSPGHYDFSEPKRLLPTVGFTAGDKYVQAGYTQRDIDLTDVVNAGVVSFRVDSTGLELTAYMTEDLNARLQPYEGRLITSMHFRFHNIEWDVINWQMREEYRQRYSLVIRAVQHPIGFNDLTKKPCADSGAERIPMTEEQKAQKQAAIAKVIQNPEQQAIIDLKAKFAADRDALNVKYTEQTTLIHNQMRTLQVQFDELGQSVDQKHAASVKDEAEQLVALRAKLL
jgi:hypothetical protein